MENSNIIPFEGREIRKVWYNEEWYFSVIDIIEFLTESLSPKKYWAKLKAKEQTADGQPFPFTERLKMKATDGKSRFTDCANTEGIMRITMSVPSPKLESLMRWFVQLCT